MLDITDLKEPSRVAEAQAKYRAIVEDIPAIVYIDEIDDEMSTSYVSPQIEALLGVTAQEYIDDPDLWYACCTPTTGRKRSQATSADAKRGSPFEFEYRLIGRERANGVVPRLRRRDPRRAGKARRRSKASCST